MRHPAHHPYWPGFFLLCVLFTLFPGMNSYGQQPPSRPTVPSAEPSRTPDESTWEAQQHAAMLKKFNLQRQQEIKKDSEKLLELATELKQSVDKSNENTLSLDVIKKAEQIEKLAKAVKDKMKGP